MDGWMDGQIDDGWMDDRWIDMDRLMVDGWMNG